MSRTQRGSASSEQLVEIACGLFVLLLSVSHKKHLSILKTLHLLHFLDHNIWRLEL